MIVTVTTPPEAAEQLPPYTIDTVHLADRLHEIRDHVAVVDVAVQGMKADHYASPQALSGLRDLLDAIIDDLTNVAADIHPPCAADLAVRKGEALDKESVQ